MQSWEWGDVLEEDGHTVARNLCDESRTERAQALSVLMRLPFGQRYFYIPRGPVGATPEIEARMLKALTHATHTQQSRPLFFRVDAARQLPTSHFQLLPVTDVQPSTTLITNISADTEALLAAMHHKTRYNIRLAKRKGVTIEDGSIEMFYDLSSKTAARHGIRLHDRKHFEAIARHLNGEGDAPRALVKQAVHDGDVLASALCIDFGNTRTYLHGASADTKKDLMAPHLLHWSLMQDAKERGMKSYDWWGIAPEGQPEHRLAGVTRFKLGFGGERVSYPSTCDVVLRPFLYAAYTAIQRVRRASFL